MINILEEIYYGNWRPDESIKSIDPNYKSINRKISSCMESFKKIYRKLNLSKLKSCLIWQVNQVQCIRRQRSCMDLEKVPC